MEQLGRFDGHVPPAILANNSAARGLVRVLDGLQAYKEQQIEQYVEHFDPRRTENTTVLRQYVDEYEGEYRPDTPDSALECLVMNKGTIFGRKGTRKGLVQWLRCITGASSVTVTYEGPFPFLHFHTLEGSVLPNGQDLLAEKTQGYKIPTLLADTWLTGYTNVVISILGGYNQTEEFKAWLLAVLPKYLPMVDGQSLNARIRFVVPLISVPVII